MLISVGLPLNADKTQLLFLSERPLAEISGASAIEVDSGGTEGIILSDRGSIYSVQFERQAGKVSTASTRLLSDQYRNHDLEGLAVGPSGAFASFERPSNVRRLHAGQVLSSHLDFAQFRPNKGLEALAIDAQGRLVAIPEKPPKRHWRFPIYRFEDGAWQVIGDLPDPFGFLPVAADFGPDGLLYLLERAFGPLGFRSRISRVDLGDTQMKREVLLKTAPRRHDNLEGLSVWTSDTGATCLTFVSDDNFNALQRAEIVEYALTETLAPGRTCD